MGGSSGRSEKQDYVKHRRKKEDRVVDGGLGQVARKKRSADSSSWLSQVASDPELSWKCRPWFLSKEEAWL